MSAFAKLSAQALPPWRRAYPKLGSHLLATDRGGPTARHAQCRAEFMNAGDEAGRSVSLVSSGAVAAGCVSDVSVAAARPSIEKSLSRSSGYPRDLQLLNGVLIRGCRHVLTALEWVPGFRSGRAWRCPACHLCRRCGDQTCCRWRAVSRRLPRSARKVPSSRRGAYAETESCPTHASGNRPSPATGNPAAATDRTHALSSERGLGTNGVEHHSWN